MSYPGARRAIAFVFAIVAAISSDAAAQASTNSTSFDTYIGAPTTNAVPIAGDFDGDARSDHALYDAATATWSMALSATDFTTTMTVPWGVSTDVPLAGDFDGDARSDIVAYRPSTGVWHILLSTTAFLQSTTIDTQLPNHIPFVADCDGNGVADSISLSTGHRLASGTPCTS
jgi:hypothetical protein